MIFLITLFSSLIIQFGALKPYNMSSLNSEYLSYIETVKSQIIANKGGFWNSGDWARCPSVSSERWIVVKGYEFNSNFIWCLCPKEDLGIGSSSISCNSYTSSNDVVSSVSLRFNGYFAFAYGSDAYDIIDDMSIYNYVTYNFNENSNSLLYCATPIYYNSTIVVNTAFVPVFSGHTQNGKNDHQNIPLPFPNVPSVTGHSSVISVDDSNTNNLLGNILNSIQYGSNSIVNGVNILGQFIGNLWGNINSTINYIIEPVDAEEFKNVVSHSPFSAAYVEFQGLKNVIDNMTSNNGVPINFTLPDSLGGGEFSFNLANYLDDSKHIWQPLLLIFLYTSAIWGLYKSFANLVNGVAPASDYVHGAFSHLYQPPVEIRPKDKKP